ncbi:MAG TPA: hypothetical protein VLX89_12300 [Actinomycetota bacterium]|nr:hypothetical protein [Actinomycetota bacterium]
MALWTMIRCERCGFSGCAAPIGDHCPRCNHPLEDLTPKRPEPATEPADDPQS